MSYYTIWMGDLPPDTRREHVVKFFDDYGSLGGVRLMNNFGFIDFKHKRDAKDAVKELNGEKLRGCRVRLEMSDGPGNRKSGTSYEETAAYSTKREEHGFNPRFERPYRTKYGMVVSNLTKKFRFSFFLASFSTHYSILTTVHTFPHTFLASAAYWSTNIQDGARVVIVDRVVLCETEKNDRKKNDRKTYSES